MRPLIITWNDWVENSQIEPSLELGDADLRECARQAAQWKQKHIDESLLDLPMRLFNARRKTGDCAPAPVWNAMQAREPDFGSRGRGDCRAGRG